MATPPRYSRHRSKTPHAVAGRYKVTAADTRKAEGILADRRRSSWHSRRVIFPCPPLFRLHPARRTLPFLCALLTLSVTALAGVDSVVTFNEVHYNPTPAQTTGEWIELKNQNTVDVDLSGWRLD